jgi:hypothetical protein
VFLDQNSPLLGNGKNYREETIVEKDGTKHIEHAEYRLDDEGNIVRLPHKHSDRIMVEVRDDITGKKLILN